ncbi:MAG: hypothetical protein A3C13_01830 [Candidatus Lloydbacteria bacterium RIFCSPHIGHO2_02_FULL_50_11]|nr:MAG: hypothetical protein A3C13_01830 [Candidatus Lloydbacteria bacterium RIFCSPHIGHO2_02_FULL_50_11]
MEETQRYLNMHGIKCFTRERSPSTVSTNEELFGFDLFILRDEDVDTAKEMLEYEFGGDWGERVA